MIETPLRQHVTGLALDPVDLAGLFDYVVAAARDRQNRRTVSYLNVNVANTAAGDAAVTRYLNETCDLVYCDGRGIGWGARLQGLPAPPRITAADWLPALLRRFRDEGLRVFVVAGKPGVVDRAVQTIGLTGEIAWSDGYLSDPKKNESALASIEAFRPDVLLVGMGTPTQERWVLENRDRIAAPVVWALGATFDYYAGEQARGPEWLRRAGHEWAARLLANPGRLWRRYVVGNPRFLLRAWLAGRKSREKGWQEPRALGETPYQPASPE